jgi:rubrerythrin
MSPTQAPLINTMANLESAFAGESMAHIKYRYFAKICRELGDPASAAVFEETAHQEALHAFSHLDLLYPKNTLTPARVLQMAIDGETYEYAHMYPGFKKVAIEEGNLLAAKEMDEQIAESQEHACEFAKTLLKAQKRFSALAKVEERHAMQYQDQLTRLAS